mmetsp:Transcript_10247/g.29204  ORF Transcript_10247/g.29204 Transcript_10247/m.29204 type:complete len:284 (-) Transcript_10247:223-1074(-)
MSLRMLIDLIPHHGQRILGQLAHQRLDLVALHIGIQLAFLLAGQQFLPCVIAFLDDGHGVLLVHEFLVQSKDVGRLAVGDFVRAEPFADGIEHAWHLFVDVLNVVEERRPLVFGVDGDDLPVGLAFVDHAEDSEDLDGADATGLDDTSTNLAHIQRIIITTATLGIRMDECRIFPCLWQASVIEENVTFLELTKLSLLFILLDGCEIFIRCDFELFASKFGNLIDVIQVRCDFFLFFIDMIQTDIVPQGNDFAFFRFLGMQTVFQCILITNMMQIDVGIVGTQ